MATKRGDVPEPEPWLSWPVYWTPVWVGALTAVALVFIFGLVGLALGAHLVGPSRTVLDWKTVGWGGLAFSVFGAFLAFVAGGWVAGKIAGIYRSEPAMLHGAIVWLVALPILVYLASTGAGTMMGSWYASMSPHHPAWADVRVPEPPPGSSAESEPARARTKAEADAATAARNAALGTVAALLLGLMGSVIGGWMASGEPMTFTHWRVRDLEHPRS